MNVLVLNAGAASLKFQVVRTDEERIAQDRDERLASGRVDRIGGEARLTFCTADGNCRVTATPIRDHTAAVETVLHWLGSDEAGTGLQGFRDIDAVGHRVAHGGERFTRSVLIDDAVLEGIEETIELAPLHNPHNLRGITAVRQVLGKHVPQAAVFDTAFHHTLPEQAFLYALPYSLYRRYRIRRYGYPGTTSRYEAYLYRRITDRSRELMRLITLHLGNGCSACAIESGQSVDTSMGFTPLEGLIMGTRSGDLDPALLDFIAAKEGLSVRDVDMLLNKQSGLLGISGLTHEMKELIAEESETGDRRARLAIDMFCYRARKYVGAYFAAMCGADAIIFTGGIGENSPDIRARIVGGLDRLGVQLDPAANARTVNGAEGRITTDGAPLEVWVIPTNEELLIARDTARLVLGLETRY
ncbi:MAG: acetate kinase, partial [Gemmatimonadetes bacterium]|nr:acetate kinase [Gemmatimonadota bacterium]